MRLDSPACSSRVHSTELPVLGSYTGRTLSLPAQRHSVMLSCTPQLVVLQVHIGVFSEHVWMLYCLGDLLTSKFLICSSISWIYFGLTYLLSLAFCEECSGCGNIPKDFSCEDWSEEFTLLLHYSFIIPICPCTHLLSWVSTSFLASFLVLMYLKICLLELWSPFAGIFFFFLNLLNFLLTLDLPCFMIFPVFTEVIHFPRDEPCPEVLS